MKKSAVLIFGTFNPVTKAHLQIGSLASEHIDNSDIYYVPAKNSFLSSWKKFDSNDIIDEKDRLRLLTEATSFLNYKVLDVELTGEVSGKTIDTVNYVKDKLGYEDVILCMGTDKLPELHTWFKAEELLDKCSFMIIERGAADFTKILNNNCDNLLKKNSFKFFNVKNNLYTDISATKVRNAYSLNDFEAIEKMVPKNVYDYLKNKQEKELTESKEIMKTDIERN